MVPHVFLYFYPQLHSVPIATPFRIDWTYHNTCNPRPRIIPHRLYSSHGFKTFSKRLGPGRKWLDDCRKCWEVSTPENRAQARWPSSSSSKFLLAFNSIFIPRTISLSLCFLSQCFAFLFPLFSLPALVFPSIVQLAAFCFFALNFETSSS